MSRYKELRRNPMVFMQNGKKKDLHIVMLKMVSAMCDNVSYIKLTKENDEEVSASHYNDHCALSFSNLQAESNAEEMMKWAMMDNDIEKIVRLANSGTSAVGNIKIRERTKETK